MKTKITLILVALLMITIAGCNKESKSMVTPPSVATSEKSMQTQNTSTENTSSMMIQINIGDNMITFELNDSKAAKNLYEQLPLSIEVENYSNNEKIFYPPKPLDISDAPHASGGLGVLAYYEPWADVILFYDDFQSNRSLYELGQVVSGSDHIQSMLEGIITITAVP